MPVAPENPRVPRRFSALRTQGWSFADIRAEDPGITDDDIRACLAYASQVLHSERIYPLPE